MMGEGQVGKILLFLAKIILNQSQQENGQRDRFGKDMSFYPKWIFMSDVIAYKYIPNNVWLNVAPSHIVDF